MQSVPKHSQAPRRVSGTRCICVVVWLEWTKEDIEMNGKEEGWGERKSQGEPHCLADDVGQAGSLRA